MLPDQTVIKEARRQLNMVNPWVITALAIDGLFEEELGERWAETVDAVLDELTSYLEGC